MRLLHDLTQVDEAIEATAPPERDAAEEERSLFFVTKTRRVRRPRAKDL